MLDTVGIGQGISVTDSDSCSASSFQAQLTALCQAEEVLSGARSQRSADMHVHASDAVQRAWRAASGGAADEQEVC